MLWLYSPETTMKASAAADTARQASEDLGGLALGILLVHPVEQGELGPRSGRRAAPRILDPQGGEECPRAARSPFPIGPDGPQDHWHEERHRILPLAERLGTVGDTGRRQQPGLGYAKVQRRSIDGFYRCGSPPVFREDQAPSHVTRSKLLRWPSEGCSSAEHALLHVGRDRWAAEPTSPASPLAGGRPRQANAAGANIARLISRRIPGPPIGRRRPSDASRSSAA